jgi:hypothetical protein
MAAQRRMGGVGKKRKIKTVFRELNQFVVVVFFGRPFIYLSKCYFGVYKNNRFTLVVI